jgi:predicted nucleotidyltransferase
MARIKKLARESSYETIDKIYQRLKLISKKLKEEYHAKVVILFGSYALGNARRDSDIDLLIIAPTKERYFERMATVRRLIREFRNGLPISPIVLTPQEVKERKKKGDPFIAEIFLNGIEL